MKDAMKFYKMLYDNGYINKDFINVKDADWSKAIQDDKVATWSHDLRNLNSGRRINLLEKARKSTCSQV